MKQKSRIAQTQADVWHAVRLSSLWPVLWTLLYKVEQQHREQSGMQHVYESSASVAFLVNVYHILKSETLLPTAPDGLQGIIKRTMSMDRVQLPDAFWDTSLNWLMLVITHGTWTLLELSGKCSKCSICRFRMDPTKSNQGNCAFGEQKWLGVNKRKAL